MNKIRKYTNIGHRGTELNTALLREPLTLSLLSRFASFSSNVKIKWPWTVSEAFGCGVALLEAALMGWLSW